jgi:hypothetical protein
LYARLVGAGKERKNGGLLTLAVMGAEKVPPGFFSSENRKTWFSFFSRFPVFTKYLKTAIHPWIA